MSETQPLLHDIAAEQLLRSQIANNDEYVVDFDSAGDIGNPRDWPKTYKWFVVLLLAIEAFTVTFTCISVVPIASHIVESLAPSSANSKSASILLVTIWELGEAGGPLLIAPLSELVGRYPVMNGANLLFIGATVLAALAQSTPLFIATRALTGLAVASNVLNPAIVGDIFVSEERGGAMSLIMLAPLLGGAVGPAIAGAIAEGLGWRAVLWMSVVLMGTCELVFLTCFRETYKVVILQRRAAQLRRQTGNLDLRTPFDVQGEKGGRMVLDAVLRPAIVLGGSGVLQAISLYGGFVFTYFYIMSTTLPDILQDIYGLNAAETGVAFISFSIGSIICVIICNLFLDRIFIKLRDANDGVEQPEYRLPLTIFGAFALPLAVSLYGWVAQGALPLPLLLVSLALLGNIMMLGFLPLMAYVVDAFRLYSASAMTAMIVTRCLMGTFLPLATAPLVAQFGYGWAFTMFAGLTLVLAPIPVLVFRYGRHWRQLSKYTKDE